HGHHRGRLNRHATAFSDTRFRGFAQRCIRPLEQDDSSFIRRPDRSEAEWRDLLSTISGLSWREGPSTPPRYARLRSGRRVELNSSRTSLIEGVLHQRGSTRSIKAWAAAVAAPKP